MISKKQKQIATVLKYFKETAKSLKDIYGQMSHGGSVLKYKENSALFGCRKSSKKKKS